MRNNILSYDEDSNDTQDNTSNGAGLFCSEGGVRVTRPSTRVSNPPGGARSYNILSGEDAVARAPQRLPSQKSQQDQNPNPAPAPQRSQQEEQDEAPRQQARKDFNLYEGPQTNKGVINENEPLFCSEGSQVRTRPSVRVREPPGGRRTYNILAPNN
eukprot:GEZU01033809.1.p1 GENE.GEZU01033809.1~~GEZU01033809.1.p1  ORF type:complete len:157 (+),score=35.36 GEZU01033809.1:62-532(+)